MNVFPLLLLLAATPTRGAAGADRADKGVADKVPAADAATPRAVRRGDALTLSARAGAVVAQVAAEAMQDGGVGETIRVRNQLNGKVLLARVVDAGQVEVSP